MLKDIKFLLVFLIIAIGVLVWLQCYQCKPVPNTGKLNAANTNEPFTVNNVHLNVPSSNGSKNAPNSNVPNGVRGLDRKNSMDKMRSSKENQVVTSKIVDNILKNSNSNPNDLSDKSRFFDRSLSEELNSNLSNSSNDDLSNPLVDDVNTDRDSLSNPDQQVLDKLIKEVNTGNDLVVDNPRSELYKSRSRSINSAKKYRKISYKDSDYRYDFNEDGSPSQTSQDELNSLYDSALVFRNNEYNTNNNYTGMSDDNDQTYGNANLNDFKPSGPQTQQEKVMQLYNSNEYLPNNTMLDKQLTKGFQILDNPVAVSNPNLIPVLKSIPVSSVMGSNKNQTYDIRAEPPCPKTVVSPFLNSSIMPDIYSTQRGCL
jgi:hypothetical protein